MVANQNNHLDGVKGRNPLVRTAHFLHEGRGLEGFKPMSPCQLYVGSAAVLVVVYYKNDTSRTYGLPYVERIKLACMGLISIVKLWIHGSQVRPPWFGA